MIEALYGQPWDERTGCRHEEAACRGDCRALLLFPKMGTRFGNDAYGALSAISSIPAGITPADCAEARARPIAPGPLDEQIAIYIGTGREVGRGPRDRARSCCLVVMVWPVSAYVAFAG